METEGRPRLRYWLDRLQADGLYSDGNEPDGLDPEVKVRAAVFLVDVWTTPAIPFD